MIALSRNYKPFYTVYGLYSFSATVSVSVDADMATDAACAWYSSHLLHISARIAGVFIYQHLYVSLPNNGSKRLISVRFVFSCWLLTLVNYLILQLSIDCFVYSGIGPCCRYNGHLPCCGSHSPHIASHGSYCRVGLIWQLKTACICSEYISLPIFTDIHAYFDSVHFVTRTDEVASPIQLL